ncbi:MAG: hypothetical protein C4523_06070 [Myxococcales bacterium]|nr:MAG: hypothetical protein C4523_06070 [Myxococcales bacterium]
METHRVLRLTLSGGLLVLALVFLLACEEEKPEIPPPPGSLELAARAYWEAIRNGDYQTAWEALSRERLLQLRKGDPELFRNAASYAAGRAKRPDARTVAQLEVLDAKLDANGRRGAVKIGMSLYGRPAPIVSEQNWRWDGRQGRWLIAPAEEGGQPAPP